MATYLVRRISWEEAEIDDADLVTQQDAAEIVGVRVQSVQSEMERGRLTMVVDQGKTWQGRRLLLRAEVQQWKAERERGERRTRVVF